jgi:hypothetical protein
VRPDSDGIKEVVGDKAYHSNQSLINLEVVGVRSYISELDRYGRFGGSGRSAIPQTTSRSQPQENRFSPRAARNKT